MNTALFGRTFFAIYHHFRAFDETPEGATTLHSSLFPSIHFSFFLYTIRSMRIHLSVFVIVLLIGTVLRLGHAASPPSSPTQTIVDTWEEEVPDGAAKRGRGTTTADDVDDDDKATVLPRRSIVSTSKEDPTSSPFGLLQSTNHPNNREQAPLPHKLRTDRWEFKVHWMTNKKKRQGQTYERLQVEFSENGYLRLISSSSASADPNHPSSSFAAIGQWELALHGVTWSLVLPDDKDDGVRTSFHGDLLLNPFGPQPRMIRGVVLRGRAGGWFRPVVGRFTGEGIGEDQADLSYRNRKSL